MPIGEAAPADSQVLHPPCVCVFSCCRLPAPLFVQLKGYEATSWDEGR